MRQSHPCPIPPSRTGSARLAPDQRAAATAPPGPLLVRRSGRQRQDDDARGPVAWLVDGGARSGLDHARHLQQARGRGADRAARRRARTARLRQPGAVRVRTFHALGREILLDAGVAIEPLHRPRRAPADARARRHPRAERAPPRPRLLATEAGPRRDGRRGRGDPEAGPVARAFVAYEARDPGVAAASTSTTSSPARCACLDGRSGAPRRAGAARCGTSSSTRPRTSTGCSSGSRSCWRPRRTGSSSSATTTSRSTAGGWPMFAGSSGSPTLLPGLRRVDLEVNYRCPRSVVERAVRLVEHNDERFAKAIRAGPGRDRAAGPRRRTPPTRPIRVGGPSDRWPDDGTTRAILARTNRELLPAVAWRCAGAAVPGAADRAAARVTRWSTAPASARRRWPTDAAARRLGRVRDDAGATGDRPGRTADAPSDRSRPRCSPGRRRSPTWPTFGAAIARRRARLGGCVATTRH